jgi:hypothetical protein
MYCLCVNVYCHRVSTQLQLTNISISISIHKFNRSWRVPKTCWTSFNRRASFEIWTAGTGIRRAETKFQLKFVEQTTALGFQFEVRAKSRFQMNIIFFFRLLPRRLNFMCRRSGTDTVFRNVCTLKFRHRGVTPLKKNTTLRAWTKFWNLEINNLQIDFSEMCKICVTIVLWTGKKC